MYSLTMGSLFDGIGGWCLAAIHAGVLPVWSSEIEPFPLEVTKRRFPYIKQLGNITKIDATKIEPVDIICAGSPCQDLSIAGKREGLQGERSGLFCTAIDIVRQMRMHTGGKFPRFFVWENVPGAFSSNKGLDFLAVLEEVCESKIPVSEPLRWANAGMVECRDRQIAWRVLDAQYWGVPQRRKRIFLVADFAKTGRSSGKILFESGGLSRNYTQSKKSGQVGETIKGITRGFGPASRPLIFNDQGGSVMNEDVISGTLRAENRGHIPICYRERCGKQGGGKGLLASNDKALSLKHSGNDQILYDNHAQDSRITGPLSVSSTVSAKYGTGGGNTPIVLEKAYCIQGNVIDRLTQQNGTGVCEDKAYTLNTVDRHVVCIGNGNAHQIYPQDKAGTLTCMHDQQIVAIDVRHNAETIVSGTLQEKNQGGYSLNYQPAVREDKTLRRLTPLECERLQGLPDAWTLIHDRSCSDSARYKAIGNGMAQPCADWIMTRIAEVEND